MSQAWTAGGLSCNDWWAETTGGCIQTLVLCCHLRLSHPETRSLSPHSLQRHLETWILPFWPQQPVEIYCDYIRNCAYFWRAQSVEWFSFWQLRIDQPPRVFGSVASGKRQPPLSLQPWNPTDTALLCSLGDHYFIITVALFLSFCHFQHFVFKLGNTSFHFSQRTLPAITESFPLEWKTW